MWKELEAKYVQFLTANSSVRALIPCGARWVWIKRETLHRTAKGMKPKDPSLSLTRKLPNCVEIVLNPASPPTLPPPPFCGSPPSLT